MPLGKRVVVAPITLRRSPGCRACKRSITGASASRNGAVLWLPIQPRRTGASARAASRAGGRQRSVSTAVGTSNTRASGALRASAQRARNAFPGVTARARSVSHVALSCALRKPNALFASLT